MENLPLWVLIVGILGTIAGLALAGKRVVFLFRLITSGQPAPDRIAGVTGRVGLAVRTQLVEVLGQKKLLKWTVPGLAHFFVFWAFLILGTVYFEAYAILFSQNPEWHWFVFGNWAVLGFAQDFIAVMCLLGIIAFWQIRVKNAPAKLGRDSRFAGSHLGGAYFVLFMIFNVLWTLFLFRGAVQARDMSTAGDGGGYGKAAFVSHPLGLVLSGNNVFIGIALLLHIGVMLVFLVDVVNSKHLHIFIAPLNVMFGRRPVALGAVKPLISAGKPLTLDDVEDLDEDAKLGVGSIEDFTWKGLLDMATCTECGRCQSQCPAWNTEKPLSPKMLILNLRDHAFAMGDYIVADESGREKMLAESDTLTKEVERPLIGDESVYGVIDPDVLWSCVNCGACVNQCPVDIEHVDHITDMRRYQVLVESNFPAELNGLFKGMESRGNPWNLSASARLDWAKDLPFEVKVVGEDIESLDEVDWLFWVGCAGAYEDRAKKTTRAVAELLDIAGVSFGILGNGETCTGDSARRAGNEFLFQGLAAQNVETFKQFKVKKVVSTCAHCFNTLKNEYKDFGIELEVVHHTQLLNRLVKEGKLTPVPDGAGAHQRSITYHDPCFIGRHNGVYSPPRELLQVLPGATYVEMERNSERSFCCGAGGARFWMEENIGTRINENRTAEAVGTGADQIAVGCPFCRVMLSDGLASAQADGEAREEVEILDVAQMLLASVKGEQATKRAPGQSAQGGQTAQNGKADVATQAEPEPGDVTITDDTVTETADAGPAAKASGGTSLFDAEVTDEPETATEESSPAQEAKAAKPQSKGGSLFDLGEEEASPRGPAATEAEPVSTASDTSAAPKDAAPSVELGSGGSLFSLGGDDPEQPAAKRPVDSEAPTPAESEPDAVRREPIADEKTHAKADAGEGSHDPDSKAATSGEADLGASGSLFDLSAPEPEAKAEPATRSEPASQTASEPEPEPAAEPEPVAPRTDEVDLGSGGSLFDIPAASTTASATDPEPAETAVEPETTTKQATTAAEVEDDVVESSDTSADAESSHAADTDTVMDEKAQPAQPAPSAPSVPAPDLSSGGSLFDIAAPEPSAPKQAATPPAEKDVPAAAAEATASKPEPEPVQPEAESAEPAAGLSGGAALSAAATAMSNPDAPAEEAAAPASEDAPAGDEPEAELAEAGAEEPAEEPEAKPAKAEPESKPASSGESHQPRSDADISSASSLFDI